MAQRLQKKGGEPPPPPIMKSLPLRSLFCLLTPLLLAVGSGVLFAQENQPAPLGAGDPKADSTPGEPATAEHEKQMPHTLVAVLTPTEGNQARGLVTFEAMEDDQVRVTARVSGLKADAKHAIHIHEFGDLSSPDGTSGGSHFNPEGKAHDLADSEERHPGDFGNLQSDAEGNANLVLTLRGLSLAEGEHAILGRAVIVHADEDKGTQPTGDAGDRIAQGVIAIANPKVIRDRLAAQPDSQKSDAAAVAKPASRPGEPTPAEELEEVAEQIGRGAEKAARTTVKAVERGVNEAEEALRKVGKTVEKAVE